jgi:hypothetical protein
VAGREQCRYLQSGQRILGEYVSPTAELR